MLPNISRDNYITLVAACVAGRMANPASAGSIEGDWNRKQYIKCRLTRKWFMRNSGDRSMSKLKKSNFTKQPWQLTYCEHNYTIHIKDKPKSVIARIGSMQACSITTKEIEANAHLLLHAPKLLKGLEEAVTVLTQIPVQKELRKKLMFILRDAKGPL